MTETQLPTSARENSPPASPRRRITPRRGLPGGRAVVGALLVAVAAVAVFAAYLDAVGGPTDRYLVATEAIAPGTSLADAATVDALFSAIALDLSDVLARRAISEDDAAALVGRTIVAALAPGELLQRSALADDTGAGDGHVLSLALPRASALGGSLVVGQRIDLVATSGRGAQATTGYVVRSVPVVDVVDGPTAGTVLVTVAVRDVAEVQAVGHAQHTADVFVVVAPDDAGTDLPAPLRSSDGVGGLDGGAVEDGAVEDGEMEDGDG